MALNALTFGYLFQHVDDIGVLVPGEKILRTALVLISILKVK